MTDDQPPYSTLDAILRGDQPPDADRTLTLHQLASAVYGEDWPRPVSRITGIALRTCQRVKAACESGVDDPRATSILHELTGRLSTLVAFAVPADERIRAPDQRNDRGRYREVFARRVDDMMARAARAPWEGFVLRGSEVINLLHYAAAVEQGLEDLLDAVVYITATEPSEDDWEEIGEAIVGAAGALYAGVAMNQAGEWLRFRNGWLVFGGMGQFASASQDAVIPFDMLAVPVPRGQDAAVIGPTIAALSGVVAVKGPFINSWPYHALAVDAGSEASDLAFLFVWYDADAHASADLGRGIRRVTGLDSYNVAQAVGDPGQHWIWP